MSPHDKLLQRLSKQMSWLLRHQADRLGLAIDPEGFVAIGTLLAHLQEAIPEATESAIRTVVETVEPHKQRFTILEDHIRANYGHSIEARIAYPAEEPPATLYHGTGEKTKDTILREGLRPMGRQFVHLTIDAALARQVGSRHGKPCILRVDAQRAWRDGVVFHHANRGFWLVDAIAARYLSE